uniref:Protein TolB n=1 Tax=Triticum urartu TaxID=4572 RepID=A0A8R7QJG0_TRIUA
MKDVGLFRVSGVFPTISKDGSKLAFINKEFKAVWIADSQGLRIVYETREPDSIFSPVWNQNPDKDILYVCISTTTSTYLNARKSLEIYAISNASGDAVQRQVQRLTYGGFNNAFPSSSPDGNKFVFQSTRDFFAEKHKNLYIMLKIDDKGSEEGWVTRLTKGSWTDTHCQWSPRGDWVAFSSTRDKPGENSMAPGSFSVYLVKAYDPTVVIKLINGLDGYRGHVHCPVFSPDGRSIAVTMDLVAVSVDRNSLPMSMYGVRPYGDIFVVNINPDDNMMRSKEVKCFRRITHSRYECSALAWTSVPADPEVWCNIM